MPSASSIAAARKDTQRLRARSRDFVRRFHRCGQKRHTTTATYISGCLLTLPSLRSEKTHNECELDQRMAFEDSIAAVRKDTQRREANALHLKRRELKRPEKTHSNSTVAEPAPAKCRILTLSSEEPQNSCDCKRSTSPAPKTMSICRCI